ncbi:MAG TPA: glycosyltransferase family 39 protein [Fimbriiglobus sp.]|jgi:hypothetical protein
MVRSPGSGRWIDVLWLLAVGGLSSAWCLTAAPKLGATFDEPFYLNAGLTHWRTGSNKLLMSAGTMTLPVDLQTLPLYLWERIRGTPFDSTADIETILPVARGMTLFFWWLLLVYAMRLGRTFGGTWGGRFAVAFVGFDPNFLGHACLATSDIAVAGCMLGLVYHAFYGIGRNWSRRVFIPGLWFGLAILAKASGMVFGMQALLVLGFDHLIRTDRLKPPKGTSHVQKFVFFWHACYPLRKDLFGIAAIGFALVFLYTGSDFQTERTFVEWADTLPEGPVKDVMEPVSRNLCIFTNAGEGLLQQVKHNLRGHGTYFLGDWYERATWKYFPVALTMKVPVPMLLLLSAVIALRPRSLNSPLGWFALVLLLFSLNCRVQLGIRFMFTLMAVTYVALAAAISRGWTGDGMRTIPRGVAIGILGTLIAASTWAWPDGICYFNQLWGGTPDGHKYLHDSNHDWGQGLPELKNWQRTHGEPPLAVWYYGTDPAVLKPPFRNAPLHIVPVPSLEAFHKSFGHGYFAVGCSLLYGYVELDPQTRLALSWLRILTPVDRTGQFFIYDLRK